MLKETKLYYHLFNAFNSFSANFELTFYVTKCFKLKDNFGTEEMNKF